nr:hypothetical protein CFP56_41017 [Quercus suber]
MKQRPSVFELTLQNEAEISPSAPKDYQISQTKKSDAEKSLEAGSSEALALDIPPLAQIPALVCGAPNYCQIPSMNFWTCASDIIHPSDIPSPHSFPHCLSDLGLGLSSIARDVEELSIGQPQTSRGTNISTQTSGAIRVT